METIIFIDEKILKNYRSNLFPLFAPQMADRFLISASFDDYRPALFPVFSDLSDYVYKVINDKKIGSYGLIVDTQKIVTTINALKIIQEAKFIFLIGPENNDQIVHRRRKHVACLYSPKPALLGQAFSGSALTELETLGQAYHKLLENRANLGSVHVLCPPQTLRFNQWPGLQLWRNKFADLGISLVYHWPTKAIYDYLIENSAVFLGLPSRPLAYDLGVSEPTGPWSTAMSVKDFGDDLAEVIGETSSPRSLKPAPKQINIVCYKPTYLFKDLTDRLVARGCVHSDLPQPEAGAYIWMRPQELWHLDFAAKGLANAEIPGAYLKAASRRVRGLDVAQIRDRSIAIHHGTCHEPIYQFCPSKLAYSLSSAAKVVGVCEFEECYGPAAQMGNRDNFEFVPIGFDHTIFTANLINREMRVPGSRLRIGFVGRAYGTTNKTLLNRSRLAEPWGFRKGGDALMALGNQLRLAGMDFELHIIGDNWDELVERLTANGVRVRYHIRDVDVGYRDYPGLYSRLDVLLITSRCEGGPVSALEALSLGVKVVGSRVGLVPYLEERLKGTESVFTYEYDHRWMIFELDKAMAQLNHIYKSPISYQDRLKTRSLIEKLTTEGWVDFLCAQAESLRAKD